MDGIAIDGVELYFLPVEESGFGRHRSGCHYVAVGQNEAALGVDDEPGCLGRRIPLGVEGPGGIHVDGYDAAGNPLEGHGPVRVAFHGRGLLRDLSILFGGSGRRSRRRLNGERS